MAQDATQDATGLEKREGADGADSRAMGKAGKKARRGTRNKTAPVPADTGAGAEDVAAPPKKKTGPSAKKARKMRRKLRAANSLASQLQQQLDETPSFPTARPASMKGRHWGLVASFLMVVLLPLAAVVFYLFAVAEDQYISRAGFIVRSQEASGANELLGGLGALAGGVTASDSDILYAFIQSEEMVSKVEDTVDLKAHFSAHWPDDWVFAIWPEASQEELTSYWQRILGISYDAGSGLIEVAAAAYDPEMAQSITQAIVDHSQARINALNAQAREDAMGYARADLDEALLRLKGAREALTQFRTRTRIVDPAADIQGRMGVMNNLQQQLATALVDFDLLQGSLPDSDPRLKKARQLIAVIRDRIDIERQTFTSDNTETGAVGEDYPSLIAEFERLTVDLEFAQESYRAALTALEVARDEATRQSRYLATYIKPTLAQSSDYPNRPIVAALAALVLLMVWSIMALVYYSIRDRN